MIEWDEGGVTLRADREQGGVVCRVFEAALGRERSIPHELNERAVSVRVASFI
jgi:hypothetical protein